MKKRAFEEPMASVRQAGRIRRGEAARSRRFSFEVAGVPKIRRRLGLS